MKTYYSQNTYSELLTEKIVVIAKRVFPTSISNSYGKSKKPLFSLLSKILYNARSNPNFSIPEKIYFMSKNSLQ